MENVLNAVHCKGSGLTLDIQNPFHPQDVVARKDLQQVKPGEHILLSEGCFKAEAMRSDSLIMAVDVSRWMGMAGIRMVVPVRFARVSGIAAGSMSMVMRVCCMIAARCDFAPQKLGRCSQVGFFLEPASDIRHLAVGRE